MRKNSARKWLHATLDLLPVIIIPLFAIFMHRHDATTYEVEVSQNEVVDFNQLVKNGNFDTDNYWSSTNAIQSVNNNVLHCELVNTGSWVTNSSTINVLYQNQYYLKTRIVGNFSSSVTCVFGFSVSNSSNWITSSLTLNSNVVTDIDYILTSNKVDQNFNIGLRIIGGNIGDTFDLYFYNCFNLTQMFGVGNEPTIEQFNSWYPNDYYDYTLSRKELLRDVSTVTYNNTDIGSQLVYALYTPINDYMNFNNVFNFGAIYDWLQLNIFNGNAPLSVFIVWNIFLYEFLMDLIFLLYALFMFFIDFCTNLIDRFHCKASGGH